MKTFAQYITEGVDIRNLSPREAYDFAIAHRRDNGDRQMPPRIANIIEDRIKKDPWECFQYALNKVGGRWSQAEDIIKADGEAACYYVLRILKKRWPEAEEAIMHNGFFPNYAEFLSKNASDQDVREWLTSGVDERLIELFNFMGNFSKWKQEWVIKKRPDLINTIWDLNPELAQKHQHELGLGSTDL